MLGDSSVVIIVVETNNVKTHIVGSLPGSMAQWQEMLIDPEQKIARPRQIYTGVSANRETHLRFSDVRLKPVRSLFLS